MKRLQKTPLPLTERQKSCLFLIAHGHTVQSAAVLLGISKRMVHVHLKVAREKLNAASTSQAIHNAVKKHILD